VRSSHIYETEPDGFADQGMFLNCVVEMTTALEPKPLLEAMLSIEQQLGRKRTVRNGPRCIDLDLLLYDDLVLCTDALTVPHPRMHERDFVMVPLMEIAPTVVHPVLQRTIEELGGQYVYSQRCTLYRDDCR
jgi:2-amino-4-hydroxy-6-hydroxymethyldihydropteridine diphosphokinase